MPNLIGLGAGVCAAACALGLGLACWPPTDKAPIPVKAGVMQPVFVAAVTPAKPAGAPVAALISSSPTDPAALARLAVALKSDPSATQGGHAGATRSLTAAQPAAPVSEAARQLCAQGLIALAAGDIAGARLILERAAEAGDARALMALGASYDPGTLARMGARGVRGDTATARAFYARALAAGMGAARERMAALDSP